MIGLISGLLTAAVCPNYLCACSCPAKATYRGRQAKPAVSSGVGLHMEAHISQLRAAHRGWSGLLAAVHATQAGSALRRRHAHATAATRRLHHRTPGGGLLLL